VVAVFANDGVTIFDEFEIYFAAGFYNVPAICREDEFE